jgi:Leucine-rich repeat (LRR) protein
MYRKVILWLFVMFFLFVGDIFAQSREEDSLALVDLYNSTNGDSWTNNTNWLSGPINIWYGVTVSGGRVTRLNLYSNNLSGTIPSSIGNLTSLTLLFLRSNNLTGSIPSSIGNLTNLTGLDLADNQLTGSIPSSIGNLTNLTGLDLADNQLTGSIPSSIGNLTYLDYLYLYNNQLTGSIPSEIGNLTGLDYLYLAVNQLTGSIPSSIGNLTNLKELCLYNNDLSGSVPSEIGNLTYLDYLYLYNNQLTGSIPSELANLSLIYDMRLNNNDFEDLPDISGLRWLRKLYIQNNKFTFEDIEPNLELSATVVYSPQDSVGNVQNDTITEGANLTISVSVGGASNEYQWKKDGSIITGATNHSYTISSAEFSDAGSYICEITNTVATALTLYSRPINVTVNPAPPKLTVTSPNGGEDWKVDSTYNITWTSNGTSGNVKIEYSTNNGSSWTEEVASTTDDGSYSWTIPDTPSDSCRVRVRDTDGSPSDVSNSTFTISVTPYITVTSPNGGEDWKTDSTYSITWTSNGTSGNVNIEYSMDNGLNWSEIIASIPDTGIYSWTIPDSTSDSCLVRVSDTDGKPTDESDSVFAISISSAVPEDKLPKIYSMSVKTVVSGNKFEVRYSIPEKALIALGVYNINGTKIKEFSEEKTPGVYKKEIDMKNSPAGLYFIKMEAEGKKFAETGKVILVK